MSHAEFLAWLRQRGPHDYFDGSRTSENFAVEQLMSYQRRLEQGQLPLRHVVWHVTNRCNLLCAHCGVRGGETRYQDLSLDQFASALPQLLRLGLSHLTLTGGEPLVRKDLFEIIAVLRLCGVKVGMVSNGHNLARFEAKFRAQPLDALSISIDGLAARHDALRLSAGSFEQTLTAVRLARSWELPLVSVNTSVWSENLADLPELRERIFAAGAQHWVLRPITRSGRAEDGGFGLNPAELESLLRFAAESLSRGYDLSVAGLGYLGPLDGWLNMSPFFALFGWDSLYILPDGGLKGFNEAHLPIEGHLLDENLAQIWYQGFGSYRQPELPAFCADCPYLGRCRGGNHAEARTGTRCIRPVLEKLEREDLVGQLLARLEATAESAI